VSSWEKEKVNGWRDGAGLAELGGVMQMQRRLVAGREGERRTCSINAKKRSSRVLGEEKMQRMLMQEKTEVNKSVYL